MASSEWIVFLAQLPSPTSSLRVSVWRRMKSAGAASLQNGAWLLPSSPKNRQSAEGSVALIQAEGGSATVFVASASGEGNDARLIAMFQANVGQEYAEFCERCKALTEELKRESDQRIFTFAELDENEEELQKLTSWHRKIRARTSSTPTHPLMPASRWKSVAISWKHLRNRCIAAKG